MNVSPATASTLSSVQPAISVLVAEPSSLLCEKAAALLRRHHGVWCVAQVNDRTGLVRGAAVLQPDYVLADLALLREGGTVVALRQVAPASRVFALVESACEPYLTAAQRVGADLAIEKGRLAEAMFLDFRKGARIGVSCAASA